MYCSHLKFEIKDGSLGIASFLCNTWYLGFSMMHIHYAKCYECFSINFKRELQLMSADLVDNTERLPANFKWHVLYYISVKIMYLSNVHVCLNISTLIWEPFIITGKHTYTYKLHLSVCLTTMMINLCELKKAIEKLVLMVFLELCTWILL